MHTHTHAHACTHRIHVTSPPPPTLFYGCKVYPWQFICSERGLELIVVEEPDDGNWCVPGYCTSHTHTHRTRAHTRALLSRIKPETRRTSHIILHCKHFLPHPLPLPFFLERTAAILPHIDPDTTAAVAVPPCHWCTGAAVDLVAVGVKCRSGKGSNSGNRRPFLIVDGTQSIGAQPFDVAEVQPDFVACSVHKWLCCPYGMYETVHYLMNSC